MALTKVATLFASAQRIATHTSAAIPTGTVTKPIIQNTAKDVTRHAEVFIDLTAVAGTNVSVDATLNGRTSKTGTWTALTPTSAWTTMTGVTQQARRFEGPLPPELQLVLTVAGTNPTISDSAQIVLGG